MCAKTQKPPSTGSNTSFPTYPPLCLIRRPLANITQNSYYIPECEYINTIKPFFVVECVRAFVFLHVLVHNIMNNTDLIPYRV